MQYLAAQFCVSFKLRLMWFSHGLFTYTTKFHWKLIYATLSQLKISYVLSTATKSGKIVIHTYKRVRTEPKRLVTKNFKYRLAAAINSVREQLFQPCESNHRARTSKNSTEMRQTRTKFTSFKNIQYLRSTNFCPAFCYPKWLPMKYSCRLLVPSRFHSICYRCLVLHWF